MLKYLCFMRIPWYYFACSFGNLVLLCCRMSEYKVIALRLLKSKEVYYRVSRPISEYEGKGVGYVQKGIKNPKKGKTRQKGQKKKKTL